MAAFVHRSRAHGREFYHVSMQGSGGIGNAAAEQNLRDICVVILNFNGGDGFRTVVNAVRASVGVRLGLVLVDNQSTDQSFSSVLEDLDRNTDVPVLPLQSPRNGGYAAGNNLGISGLPARYIALLNCDAVVGPDTFATLVAFMDSTPDAGACGPRLDWPDGRAQPFSYGGDPTPEYLLARALTRRRGRALHRWEGAAALPVDWVAGTCMLIRAIALATTGLLDERIFMYFEDNDFCLRLRSNGWRVYFVPTARVTHYNQPSYADRARVARYYRGLSLFYAKHYGWLAGAAVRLLACVRVRLRFGSKTRM